MPCSASLQSRPNLAAIYSISVRNLANCHSSSRADLPTFHSHSIQIFKWLYYAFDQALQQGNNSVMNCGIRFCGAFSHLRLLAYCS